MANNDMERTALLMMKGILLEMPQEQRNGILDLVEKFKSMAKEAGDAGSIALTIASIEASLEDKS